MLANTHFFSSFSVPDIAVAKKFYGETLGLTVSEIPEGLEIKAGSGEPVFVYPSPTNKPADFTVLNFIVDDIEKEVDALLQKGVAMEQYAMPEIKTNEKGVAKLGGRSMSWFKDPAGNICALLQESK